MNKTKKDKYLRKNRRISKKNKTRKVQRGGVTAVHTGINTPAIGTGAPIIQNQPTLSSLTGKGKEGQPVKPLTPDELKKKTTSA